MPWPAGPGSVRYYASAATGLAGEGGTAYKIFFGQLPAGLELEQLAYLVFAVSGRRLLFLRHADTIRFTAAVAYAATLEDAEVVAKSMHHCVAFDDTGAWVVNSRRTPEALDFFATLDPRDLVRSGGGPQRVMTVDRQQPHAATGCQRGKPERECQ